MAQQFSFDVTSSIDLQEVDNAVNQARKELGQRYDFKGSPATIELDQKAGTLTLTAEDDFKLERGAGDRADAARPAQRAGEEPQAGRSGAGLGGIGAAGVHAPAGHPHRRRRARS